MSRPYLSPDPKDRSPNEPSIIISAAQILGLYNQDPNNKEKRTRVNDTVKDWYKKAMLEIGWSKVEFSGNQCFLTADVRLDDSSSVNQQTNKKSDSAD